MKSTKVMSSYMRMIILLLLALSTSFNSAATQQAPDSLIHKGQQLTLNTSWAFPSPLETYFHHTNQKSIFTRGATSTGNYRGHIAYWLIENDKLFLKEVRHKGETQHPSSYGIKSILHRPSTGGAIVADWFNGVIAADHFEQGEVARLFKATYYFHIREGVVVAKSRMSEDELEVVQNSEQETVNAYLKPKLDMLALYKDYTDYYFRLSKEDSINVGQKQGLFRTTRGLSPLLTYFNNNHILWPFNWENRELNGAPNCQWEIDNDKIFLTDIELHSGSDFDDIDLTKIELKDVFPHHKNEGRIFAEWVSGVFLIVYGQKKESEKFKGVSSFVENQYTFLSIKSGTVQESYTIDANVDMDKIIATANETQIKLVEGWMAR